MGTDIHFFTERREGPGAPWEPFILERPCTDCKRSPGKFIAHDGREMDCFTCRGTVIERGYGHRNYNVFAMLADVRNGFGFAGVRTSSGFKPVSSHRGLPEDVSEEFRKIFTEDSGDYDDVQDKYGAWPGEHSLTYVTLRELMDYPIDDLRATLSGVITWEQFLEWKENTSPESWCGGVSGPSIRVLSYEQTRMAIQLRKKLSPEKVRDHFKMHNQPDITHVSVEWDVTYRESAYGFFDEIIPALSKYGAPDDVRCIYNFDS